MELKDLKKIGRALKMPGKTHYSAYPDEPGTAQWSKSGGHAGRNTICNVVEAALAAGFKPGNTAFHGCPDGSTMGSERRYVKDNMTLVTSSSYGATANSNHFYIRLTVTEPKK